MSRQRAPSSGRATRARPAAATPPSARRDRHAVLLEKYRILCEKHVALVERHAAVVERSLGIVPAALHAFRAGPNAIALVHDGAVSQRNTRFAELSSHCPGAFRPVPPGGAREVPDGLPGLARALDAELPAAAGARLDRRYAHESGAVLDVTASRLGPATTAIVVVDATVTEGLQRDLARLRGAAARQEHLRTLGELLAGVAHDVNNVLQTMELRIDVMNRSAVLPAEHRENLHVLGRIVRDAALRVRRVQELSSPGRKIAPRVELAAIVEDAVDLARPHLDRFAQLRGIPITVRTSAPRDLPAIRGDPAELRHVFLNLLLNARDAMPAGGAIEVVLAAAGAWVVATVADGGTGIEPRNLGHVFEPFFTTKGEHGTGLGLANASETIRRAGGFITAANRPGGGAIFTLTFPATLEAAPAPEEAPPLRVVASPPGDRPLHVLVVDDDPDLLETTRCALEGHGFRVAGARSGAEAIAAVVAGERFDVVLSDVDMPEVSGFEVAAELRRADPALPVVLLTGAAEEVRPDDPRRAQVARMLGKPFSLDRLVRVLAEVARPPPPLPG